MVAIRAPHDHVDFLPIGAARGAVLFDEVSQGLLTDYRIDDFVHLPLGVVEGRLRHLKEDAGLARDPFEICQECFIDAFFCIDSHFTHDMEEQLDETIRDLLRTRVAEERHQAIPDGVRMPPGGRQRFGGDPQLHPPERAGGERDQQILGQGETLSLLQFLDVTLKTVEAATSRIDFEGAQRPRRCHVREHGIDQMAGVGSEGISKPGKELLFHGLGYRMG